MASGAIFEHDGGLDRYLDAAEDVSRELRRGCDPLIGALRSYDAFMGEGLWTHTMPHLSGSALVMVMHAYTVWMAGVRTALGSHAAAVYPLQRTALEAACYGLLMQRQPDLVAVWTDRHEGEEQTRACRNAFTVKKAMAHLTTLAPDMAELVLCLYNAAIDFGAHPNVFGVARHLTLDEDRDDGMYAIRLAALHGSGATETLRGLIACLDYGLGIAAVAMLSPEDPADEAIQALQALSDLKNHVAGEYVSPGDEDVPSA